MPTITGDLRLITNQPAAVTALQIHAPEARTSAGTVILPAPAIVPVTRRRYTPPPPHACAPRVAHFSR